MIPDGPDAGHWIDPHNERIAYRTIMVRAMVETRLALFDARARTEAADAERLDHAIAVSLNALETEMADAGGAASPGQMIEIYRGLDDMREKGWDGYETRAEVRSAIEAIALDAALDNAPIPDAATGIFLAKLRR